MKRMTIREAAELTKTSKSTVRRYLDQLQDDGKIPAGGITHEMRSGHAVIMLSDAVVELVREACTVQTTVDGADQNTLHDAPDAPRTEPRTEELIAELKDRVSALTVELAAKNEQLDRLSIALDRAQEATAAAQALHAATAEQLKLLTAGTHHEAQEPPQDAPQPEQGTDTTKSAEDAQEATTEPTVPEITRRATFTERLRFLFTGK